MAQGSKQRGLGRGLSALLAEANENASEVTERADQTLPIERIVPNPDQPRKVFNQPDLEELAESIRARGIIQPLIVRPDPDGSGNYQIVAGERRWRAAQLARLHEVPVILRDYSDADTLEIALLENIQRTDLNPIEEARALRQLMQRFGHSQDELARQLGKSRSHLANTMRLLNLPDSVTSLVEENKLSAGHARSLLSAADPEALAIRVVDEGLSVRAVEGLVKQQSEIAQSDRAGHGKTREKDADTLELEREISAATDMKVSVDWNASTGKGTLKIKFTDLEQLDWLKEKLG